MIFNELYTIMIFIYLKTQTSRVVKWEKIQSNHLELADT